MKVTVFDYGAGNLHSLVKAIAGLGLDPVVEENPVAAANTDFLVLPGVGAFSPAAERLAPGRQAIREAVLGGVPCLGICLGLQLLFDGSEEGPGAGLGVIPGQVTRLAAARLPQIGWNEIEDSSDPAVSESGIRYGYYANSFVGRPTDPGAVTSWSRYEDDRFPATVRVARTLGVQFHPEKSSEPGLRMIRRFVEEIGG